MRSVSLPSKETDLYFSVTLTTPEQPAALHERLPLAVLVGVPVESDTAMLTTEPAQTGIREAVHAPLPEHTELGSTILPVMVWNTFGLFDGL